MRDVACLTDVTIFVPIFISVFMKCPFPTTVLLIKGKYCTRRLYGRSYALVSIRRIAHWSGHRALHLSWRCRGILNMDSFRYSLLHRGLDYQREALLIFNVVLHFKMEVQDLSLLLEGVYDVTYSIRTTTNDCKEPKKILNVSVLTFAFR